MSGLQVSPFSSGRREFLKAAAAGAVGISSWASLFAESMSIGGRPKALVLGGTAFGLGVAFANPGRCVVVERGIHLAPEFSQTGDWGELGVAATAKGGELSEAIRAAGLVTDGRIELPPLSDFLHKYVGDKGLAVFCNAELVSFGSGTKTGRAVVCGGGSSGMCEVDAAELLDTTPVGWRDCGIESVESRTFSALTAAGMVSVTLPANVTRREARLRLWENAGSLAGENKAICEVNELGTVYRRQGGKVIRRKVAGNWTWLPSAQFGTFMSAFEEGLKCSLA